MSNVEQQMEEFVKQIWGYQYKGPPTVHLVPKIYRAFTISHHKDFVECFVSPDEKYRQSWFHEALHAQACFQEPERYLAADESLQEAAVLLQFMYHLEPKYIGREMQKASAAGGVYIKAIWAAAHAYHKFPSAVDIRKALKEVLGGKT